MIPPFDPNSDNLLTFNSEVDETENDEADNTSIFPPKCDLLGESNAKLKNEIETFNSASKQRKMSIGDPNLIFDSISLGSMMACNSLFKNAEMEPHETFLVISVCDDIPQERQPTNIERFALNISTMENAWLCENGIKRHLKAVFQLIDQARIKKHEILVHCSSGQSRSCTLLIAYFMWSTGLSYDPVLAFIRSKRTCASPLPELKNALTTEYAAMLEKEKKE